MGQDISCWMHSIRRGTVYLLGHFQKSYFSWPSIDMSPKTVSSPAPERRTLRRPNKRRDYEIEWHEDHEKRRRHLSKETCRINRSITDQARADAYGIASIQQMSPDRRRAIYYYNAVLQAFPAHSHGEKRSEWRAIWAARMRWSSGQHAVFTRKIIRRVYYLFEDRPELAQEFGIYLPSGWTMSVPHVYTGIQYDLMSPRFDAIRPKIWKALLKANKYVEAAASTSNAKFLPLGSTTPILLYLNKPSSMEATRTLYSENTFLFAFEEGAKVFCRFMHDMPRSSRMSLRRIHLVFNARMFVETTDDYASAGLAYFAGNHAAASRRSSEPVPRASLEELSITIKGDVRFTRYNYILITPREAGKRHTVDRSGRIGTITLTNRFNGRKVQVNGKYLHPSPYNERVYCFHDPTTTGTNNNTNTTTLAPENEYIKVLLLQQKAVVTALFAIQNISRFQVYGRMEMALRRDLHRALAYAGGGSDTMTSFFNTLSDQSPSVLASARRALTDEQAPFRLNDMRRISERQGGGPGLEIHLQTNEPVRTGPTQRFVMGFVGGWHHRSGTGVNGGGGEWDDGWYSDDGMGFHGARWSRHNRSLGQDVIRRGRDEVQVVGFAS